MLHVTKYQNLYENMYQAVFFFTYFIQTKLSSEVLFFFSSYAVNRKTIMTPFLSYL